MTEVPFKNKLVALMNKSIEPGRVMNALAHMCIGLGSVIGQEALRLTDYRDADGLLICTRKGPFELHLNGTT